ncbi:MAG: hypothetical protein D3908_04765 [Candidatus Electrothrix sp. AUS4]|nr:hypothetical protein [Candidatus Electrothrix sp. AUS4]
MPLTGKSSEEITKLEEDFISNIPEKNAVSNKALRETLGWETDLYQEIKKRLVSDGTIIVGRGRGGSVKRLLELEDEQCDNVALEEEIKQDRYPNEESLYDPMLDVVRHRWAKDQPFDQVLAERTDKGGRRKDGTWTRPDITVAAMTSYTYVPGRFFDVITFEIKHYTALNVTAVYEALAHRRAATRAYVVAYLPINQEEQFVEILDDIYDEAKKHGIGLIIAGDPEDYDTWEIKEEATRSQPDPVRLNEFIRGQLQEGSREQIVRWFR